MRFPRRGRVRTHSRWRRARRKTGDHYVLNGRKLWITNALRGRSVPRVRKREPRRPDIAVSRFLRRRDSPGFSVGKKEDKLGIGASSTCELLLDNCRVPEGECNAGERVRDTRSPWRRSTKAALESALRWSAWLGASLQAPRIRQASASSSASPIAEFQGVQFDLARMATGVAAARLLVYNAARLRDAGLPFTSPKRRWRSITARRLPSRWRRRLSRSLADLDLPAITRWRSSTATPRSGRIYEGTSNMQLSTIAKQVLGG